MLKRAPNKMEGKALGPVTGEDTARTKLSREFQTNSISSFVSPKKQKPGCWLQWEPKKHSWNKVALAAALGNLSTWSHLAVNSCHSECSAWVVQTVIRIIKDKSYVLTSLTSQVCSPISIPQRTLFLVSGLLPVTHVPPVPRRPVPIRIQVVFTASRVMGTKDWYGL